MHKFSGLRLRRAIFTLGTALAAAAIFSAFVPAPVYAANAKAQAVATATAEMGAFSAGNRAAFTRAFAPDATIVDDGPPFILQGPGSAAKWYDANRPGLKGVSVTHGSPLEISAAGKRVFLVLPITISGHDAKGSAFKAKGYWTGVLAQQPDGTMRIAALTITITQ